MNKIMGVLLGLAFLSVFVYLSRADNLRWMYQQERDAEIKRAELRKVYLGGFGKGVVYGIEMAHAGMRGQPEDTHKFVDAYFNQHPIPPLALEHRQP